MSLRDPIARKAYFSAYYRANREKKMAARAAHYAANHERILADQKKSYARRSSEIRANDRASRRQHLAKWLLKYARMKARNANVPFNLTLADIIVPTHCPALGLMLCVGEKCVHAASPTVDRFAPELGYIRGNITVISHRANAIKTDATLVEVRAVARWMAARARAMA